MLKTILLKAREKISFQNFKEFNFKKHFKLFSLFLLLIIFGLALPQGFAHADVASWVMDHTLFPVLYVVFAILLWVGFIITSIAAYTLNATLNPAIMNQVFANPAIYQGWTLIRDICNLLFLLIMLLVAFGTIVQSSKYNIKNSLLKLILAIFLINFSNVIAGAIIDFGNILMYGILGWMCAIPDSCFSNYMGGLMKVAWNFADTYSLLKLLSWDGINSTQVIGAAVAMVYLFMYGFILLALAAFLMVRTAGLALLLILAPFAYFGEVMPGMEKISSKWWNNIWSYTLFGPIFALMLYIAGELAQITIAVPPITDPNLGWYSGTIVIIISNILPLLFLLAIIPITKELGLAGTDVIMKNTTGLGQNIAKYAGGATDRWLARGAQDQRQGLKGRLNRARAYLSPGVAKRAWKSRTADQEHDYDMATGQTKDRMNWKRKGVESERDNIAENEAHRQFGEMNVKNTDEMVAKLAKAIEDKDGFLAAEIMRALAVNGDTNDALDRLSKSGDHTAADYNQFMNDSIKPLLGEEKTGKLSEDIGKSEEKDGTYIYGGHNEYDKKNDKYKMRDMFERDEKGNIKKDTSGKDIMNNNVVAKQVDFMLGRWDSKNEQNRMSNVSKTSFVDKNGNYTVQGAALLSQMGAPETVEKANRLKPKAAKAIYEGRQKPNSEAVFKNEIFTNEKTSKDLKLKDLQKIVGVNNKAEADKIYNKIEKNLKGTGKKKYKGGGMGAGQVEAQETQKAREYREAKEARAKEEEEEEMGTSGGSPETNKQFIEQKFAGIRAKAENIKSGKMPAFKKRESLDNLHSEFTKAVNLTDVEAYSKEMKEFGKDIGNELEDIKKEEVEKTLEAIRAADRVLGEEIGQAANKSGGADLDSGETSGKILKESEEYFEEAFEEVKPYNPTLPNYYKDQSGSLGNFAANLKEEKADSETVNFVNKAVAKNRSAMANNLRQNDMAQLYDATPKSFGNKDMRERKEIDLKKYINKIKQGSFKFGDIEKRFPKVDEMIGKVGGSAGNMFGVEYEKAKLLYDFAKESKNPKEQQAYLAMAEHTLDSIENGLGDKKTREILEKGLL